MGVDKGWGGLSDRLVEGTKRFGGGSLMMWGMYDMAGGWVCTQD